MTSTDTTSTDTTASEAPNEHGYRAFRIGGFGFRRDEHFVHIDWPTGSHVLAADVFLKALMRDISWNFFYGIVNFDDVFGTMNHYGNVDMFAGRYNAVYRKAELDHQENFDHAELLGGFKEILADWTNADFDPFASPQETGTPFGPKQGDNAEAINRTRVLADRMVGVSGDEATRTDDNGFPINRMFADVDQSEPEIHPEPGYEDELAAFSLFAYLSRSDVTWNPSVVSVCRESLYCPTTEEFILPIIHGNDRVEWFVQLSDEITWKVQDRETGAMRATVVMKAGDCAAMPADIRHQGFSSKRSMLLVWENAAAALPDLIASGQAPTVPVTF